MNFLSSTRVCSIAFGFSLFALACGDDAGDSGSGDMDAAVLPEDASDPSGDSGRWDASTNPMRPVMLNNVPCASPDITLPSGWAASLEAAGFTKCVAPFGVVVASPETVPDSYIDMVARIIGELLDPDMDGLANDPGVRGQLAMGRNVWLPMPVDESSWTGGAEEALGRELGSYGIMIPSWWLGGFDSAEPNERARQVMVEEVVHAFTQFGYAEEYPEVFGVSDWTSVIGRETMRAQCDWWQHPENSCPGRPSMGGDCSDPSCDIVEFFQQVVVLRAGMTPGWLGIGFPRDRDTLEGLLSDDIKAAIDNRMYNQLRQPLSFTYGQ
jgi:hypothetical protein